MLLVPAGPIVDGVIRDLMPYLDQGDQIIDAGNSHFKDTDLRENSLQVPIFFYTAWVSPVFSEPIACDGR